MSSTQVPGSMPAPAYWKALDGVRALAVIGVILIHANLFFGGGGDFGVTAFFVLSGFLITLIIAREHESTGSVSLRSFYRRRFLRLLPALVAVLTVTGLAVLIGVRFRTPGTLPGIPVALLYVSNIARSWWGWKLGAVGHTWSLAMEEQFYLVWPPLFGLMLWRGWRPARVATALLGGAALSAAWASYYWHAHPAAATVPRLYFAPEVEAQPLLIGCATAAVFLATRDRWSATARQMLTVLSQLGVAVMALMALIRISDAARYNGGLTLFSLCAAVLILRLVVVPPSLLDRALSVRPLVSLGRISYGVYLWNLPVVEATSAWLGRTPLVLGVAVQIALSIGCAAVSYHLVERRFLARKARLATHAGVQPAVPRDAPVPAIAPA